MVKTKFASKILSPILIFVLVAAIALISASCGRKTESGSSETSEVVSEEEKNDGTGIGEDTGTGTKTVGEGEIEFTFEVTDGKGEKTVFTMKTDKKTVGDALAENGLIEGEAGDYGLYVKKVLGNEADYSKDGAYWAFYVDGQYAMSGVDKTDIVSGAVYAFKYEK